MPDPDNSSGKMLLYLEEVRWRRDDQLIRARGLDRKLATLFALNAAAVALFAALLSFSSRSDSSSLEVIVLLGAALASFLGSLVLSALAYRASGWVRRPDLATLQSYLDSYDEAVMIAWVADEIRRELSANEERIKRKAGRVTWSISLSVLTVILLATVALKLWLSQ